MKLFKNEDDKEVVYVQMQDMGFLNSIDDPIPATIFIKVFGNGITIIGDENRFDYIKFEQDNELEFFRDLDAVVDFDEINNLSLEEIEKKANDVGNKIENIVNKYNAMSKDDRRKNANMLQDFEKLKYRYDGIATIYSAKYNQEKLPMPNEPIQKVIKKRKNKW